MKIGIFVGLIFFVSFSGFGNDRWTHPLDLGCGTYQARGHWGQNSQGQFIFTARRGTTSNVELLVVGGSTKDKLDRSDESVLIEFYVPKKLSNASNSVVFLEKFLPLKDASTPEIKLIKRESCGLGEKFKQYE